MIVLDTNHLALGFGLPKAEGYGIMRVLDTLHIAFGICLITRKDTYLG